MPADVWDDEHAQLRPDAAVPTSDGTAGLPARGHHGAGSASVRAWVHAAEKADRFDLAVLLRGVPTPTSPATSRAQDAVRKVDLVALERGTTSASGPRPSAPTDPLTAAGVTPADGPLGPPSMGVEDVLASATARADDALDLAVDLLLTGDAEAAEAVLQAAGLWRLPHRVGADPRARASLVVAACQATLGDDAAFARLLAAAPGNDWLPVYLLATAADARGERELADQAWSHAVEQLGQRTSATYPHWAAARVAGRSHVDSAAAMRCVVEVARAAGGLPHDLSRDPYPVLRALDLLVARGDSAGACLLGEAVTRLHPPSPVLVTAVGRLVPAGAVLDRRLHRALLILMPLLALLGPLGAAVALGMTRLQHRGRVRGLGLVDGQVWRRLQRGRFDPGLRRTVWDGGHATTVDIALGAIGLVGGMLGAAALLPMVTDAFGWEVRPDHHTAEVLLAALWAVGPPVALVLGWRRFRGWWGVRQARRRREHLDVARVEQLSRCLCLRAPVLRDDEAVLYAQNHLRPATLDGPAVAVLRGLGPRASLTACPLTGILWLGVDLAPGAPAWLARGAVPSAPEATATVEE